MKTILHYVLPIILWCPVHAADSIPAHRAKQIHEAAPSKAQVTPARDRRVLIWITRAHRMPKDPHKGYCIPYGIHAFQTLGSKTKSFNPVVSDDLSLFLPENLNQFDAIVMNNSSGPWITPTEEDMKRADFRKHGATANAVEQILRRSLLDYVRNGGGIVSIHYATGANRHWPEFQELLGAKYAGHPWNEEIGINIEEPNHPVLSAFKGRTRFRLADEIYQYDTPYDRSKVRVLLSLDPHNTNMDVKWIKRKDNDFALAWIKSFGKGRVFVTSFGHRTEIYWNQDILQLYLDAIQFATGDLKAPTAPRERRDPDRAARVSKRSEPDHSFTVAALSEIEPGFTSIFNGKNLDGWEGDTRYWSVRNGTITAETTLTNRVKENNFLIWKGGQPADFELKLQYKLTGGNSGIYFHAEKRKPGAKGEALVGPQADFSADHKWTGVIMEYTKRNILAPRGTKSLVTRDGQKKVTGSVGDPTELLKSVNDNDWNDYHVIVRGESVILKINGVTMCELTDQDPRRTPAGHLALQVHQGPPMTVQFRNIRINLPKE